EYASAVRMAFQNQRYDPRLSIETRDMTGSTDSSGGFLIPTEYASAILDTSLESEIVRPRATVWPMKTRERKVPAISSTSHAAGALFGGVSFAWTAEGATISSSDAKLESINLRAHKFAALTKATDELIEDGLSDGELIERIFLAALPFELDSAFLHGDGAGKPQGIFQSDALVTVAAEAGQAANSIQFENCLSMMSRIHPRAFQNSVWVATQTSIRDLMSLSLPLGTAGERIPILKETDGGEFNLLTRPLIFSEKLKEIGTKGDILLADFSAYAIGMVADARMDMSPFVDFEADKIAFRFKSRLDGQPVESQPLTPREGSTTTSSFVTLAERS
ncbi:MAG TPA: phage major capsid protein, partial [Alphaproteobacteria bacterium]|nr:phage major capsid protein [Alphaproteobacteria bacterium]